MTVFEYLLVLISVVLSLGVAHLLTGVAQLIKAGSRVRWSVTYALWLLIVLFMFFDMWTSLWGLREVAALSLLAVIACFLTIALIYLTSVLVVPDLERGEKIDLWAFHMSNRRRYLATMVAYLLCGAMLNVAVLPAEQFAIMNLTAIAPGLAIILAALVFSNRWVQRLAPVAALAVSAVYLATYFGTLGG